MSFESLYRSQNGATRDDVGCDWPYGCTADASYWLDIRWSDSRFCDMYMCETHSAFYLAMLIVRRLDGEAIDSVVTTPLRP